MPPPPESTGTVAQAVSDEPGDHGAHQRWVRCPHRIKEGVADPLGPVIAHGFEEAPGYTPGSLDGKQRKLLRHASLRTRDDGGPNTVLYQDLDLPKSPTDADVAQLVTGAIVLAGKRVPADAAVGLRHLTSPDDGAGHALMQYRTWDVVFREQGTMVSDALCQIIAPLGDPAGCQGVCAEAGASCSSGCDMALEPCIEGCGSDSSCIKGCNKTHKSCSKSCDKQQKGCRKVCKAAPKKFGGATLTCRLPVGTEPLSFEPFEISRAQAEQIAAAAREPELSANWGSSGSGDGQFMGSLDVAAGPSGDVYVTDRGNHRVQKFDSSGAFLAKWGTQGSGDGQLQAVFGIDVDALENVYVADTNNHRVQKFDASGAFLTKWGSLGTGDGQLAGEMGIAIDRPSGHVYVADTGNHRVQKFDSSGAFLAKWGTQGSGDGQLDQPADVAVDALENVYVADTGNHRVQKFDASGAFLAKWGTQGSGDGQLDQPTAVAVDAAGHVYVADTNNHRVQKFDANGAFLAKWGTQGSGDGQLDQPMGLGVDATSGAVYVADTLNDRIQKFAFVPVLVTSSKRYQVSGGDALARYYVVTFDGERELGVAMDGAGAVLSITPRVADLSFEGWDLDYATVASSSPLQQLDAPVDVGAGHSTHLDTLPVIPSLLPQPGPSCLIDWSSDGLGLDASLTTKGFVICGNGFYDKLSFLHPAAPLLPARPPDNDFTPNNLSLPAVLPVRSPLLGPGFGPGLARAARISAEAVQVPGSEQQGYFGAVSNVTPINVTAVNASPWHHAELQAFYNAGALQKRYRLLGHPRLCEWYELKLGPLPGGFHWCNPALFCSPVSTMPGKPTCDPSDPQVYELMNQDPYRLEIKVHWRTDHLLYHSNGQAGLNFLRMGDFQTQGVGGALVLESVADVPFSHEYQHHIFRSLEDMEPWQHGGGPRGAIDEGLGDAFAALWTGHAYGPRGYQPVDPQPCANPSAYPDNAYHVMPRHACNSVAYGYWDPNAPNADPDPNTSAGWEMHRRGSIVYGALYRFARRFLDGGFGYFLPGQYIYPAQKALTNPGDEEHVLLDQMLALIEATPARRYRQLAQAAFAEKNVLPQGASSECTASIPFVCAFLSAVTLSMAGPLNAVEPHGSGDEPTFDLFVPQGALYDPMVGIELCAAPTFAPVIDGQQACLQAPLNATAQPNPNHAPKGFFRYTPPLGSWVALAQLAEQLDPDNPRIFYRVRQCQLGQTSCVVTSQGSTSPGSVPNVLIGDDAIPNVKACAMVPGPARGGAGRWGAALLAALLLATRRRRRRSC